MTTQRPQVAQSCSKTRAAPIIAGTTAGEMPTAARSATSSLIAPKTCRRQISVAAIDSGSDSSLAASAYRRAASLSASIPTSPKVVGHRVAQSPGESNGQASTTVNIPDKRLSAFDGFGGQIVWPRIAGIAAILTPWALAALIGWVMSVWL